MSLFRCGICDEYKDADIHGCFEHPTDEYECICEYCDTNKEEDKYKLEFKNPQCSDYISKLFNLWATPDANY